MCDKLQLSRTIPALKSVYYLRVSKASKISVCGDISGPALESTGYRYQ
jgi:hypothetical protein